MVNQYCAHSFASNWQLPFLNQREHKLSLKRRDTLGRLSIILTFVTSCLYNCTPISFWNGIYSERKDIALLGNKFFPFRVDSFSEGRKKNELYPLKEYQFPLTPSARQTKTDTCANSVDPDETARNEPSHQDLHCLPFFVFFFILDWNPYLHQWT